MGLSLGFLVFSLLFFSFFQVENYCLRPFLSKKRGNLSYQLPAVAGASFYFPALNPLSEGFFFLVLSYMQMGISMLLNRHLKLDKIVEKIILYFIVFRKYPALPRELTRLSNLDLFHA